MGTEGLARLVSKRLPELGLIANLVEFPAVPKGAARVRMQVMANHSKQNIVDAVQILKTARQQAELEFEDKKKTYNFMTSPLARERCAASFCTFCGISLSRPFCGT